MSTPGVDVSTATPPGADLVTTEVVDGELVDAPRGGARLQIGAWLAEHRPGDPAAAQRLAELGAAAERLADAAQAPATVAKYDAGWADFTTFTTRYTLQPGPPAAVEVVALYLAELVSRGLAVDTIGQRLAAIRDTHHRARIWSPTADPRITAMMAGIRREHGRPSEGKAPISLDLLAAMLYRIPTAVLPAADTPADARAGALVALRDRALLTTGWWCGLRRAELVALTVDCIEATSYGLRILIPQSKTDPAGTGRWLDLPHAPPELAWLGPGTALMAWLAAAGRDRLLHQSGQNRPGVVPVFSGITRGARPRTTPLSEARVAVIVKEHAAAAGLTPDEVAVLSAHSLRAGLATTADLAGVPAHRISRLLGHTSTTTAGYIRPPVETRAHEQIYQLALHLKLDRDRRGAPGSGHTPG